MPKIEYCFCCGEPTGKAGPGDGSIYCECGAGPLCEECWELHNCPYKEKENDDAE